MPGGIVAAFTSALGAVGVGEATAGILGTVLGDASIGALAGGTLGEITGQGFGKGALAGALTGGTLGFAGPLAEGLGISSAIGTGLVDAGLGAAGGSLGALATGGNIGQGALYGAAAGGLTAALGGGAQPGQATQPGISSPSGAAGASGGGAAGSAVTGAVPDLTAAPLSGTSSAPLSGLTDVQPSAVTGLTAVQPSSSIAEGIESVTSTAPLSGVTGASAFNGAGGAIGGSLAGSLPGATDPGITGTAPTFGGTYQVPSLTGDVSSTGAVTSPAPSGTGAGGSGILNFVEKHPSTALAGLGLAYQAATAPSFPSASELTGSLKNTAGALQAQSGNLMSFINNGQLPPGVKSSVDNAAAAAKATIRSRYAAMGLSGSTSEATALAGVDQQVATQTFDIANNLLQTGIKESQLSANIYDQILQESDKKTQTMSSAIANFAASLAGGGKGITLNVGQG